MSQELIGSLVTLLVMVLVGAIGTALEAYGNAKKWPWLVSAAKKLEAIGSDGPKLAGKRAPDESILKAEIAGVPVPTHVLRSLALPADGTWEDVERRVKEISAG